MLCTYPKPNENKVHMEKIQEQLKVIADQMYHLRRQVEGPSSRILGIRRKSATKVETISEDNETNEELDDDSEYEDAANDEEGEQQASKPLDPNMSWLSDESLNGCRIQNLSENENLFWKGLINLYLYPLPDDPEEKKRIANQLKDLRNKVVFGFLMINSLFVLIVFFLQMQKDTLHVKWPLNIKANITYIRQLNMVDIQTDPLKLEPINLVMVFFFMLILIIQFIAMLMHRTETLSHILAATELHCCCSRNVEELSGDENVNKNAVHIARAMQKLKDDKLNYKEKIKPDRRVERRPTMQVLENRQHQKPKFKTLADAFRTRYESLAENSHLDKPVMNGLRKLSRNPEALEALKRRASTYVSHSRPQTPASTRTEIRRFEDDIRRLNEAFGTPNGSVRSGFLNLAYNDDSSPSSRGTPIPLSPFQSLRVKLERRGSISNESLKRKLAQITENC